VELKKTLLKYEKLILNTYTQMNNINSSISQTIYNNVQDFINSIDDELFESSFKILNKRNNLKIKLFQSNETNILSLFMLKHLLFALLNSGNGEMLLELDDKRWQPFHSIVYQTSDNTNKFLIHLTILNIIPNRILNNVTIKLIKKCIFGTLEDLSAVGIINIKTLNKNKKSLKFIYISLNNIKIFKYSEFYETPSQICIINTIPYAYNIYYMSVHEIYRKNIYNSQILYPDIAQLSFIINLMNLKLYPNKKLLELCEEKILEKTRLNKDWIVENWWKSDILEKIKKIPENFAKSSINGLNINEKNRYWNKISLQKKFSELSEYAAILNFHENFHNIKNGFFMSFFIDFRWRIYGKGDISHTNNKLIRHLLYYGEYTNNELTILEEDISKTKSWTIVEKQWEYISNRLYLEPNKYKNYTISAIFWSLIELGKLKKNILIENGHIPLKKFLDTGIELYHNSKENKKENFNNENLIIYENTLSILENLIKNTQWKKEIFYKDATASVIQHLLKILGYKNENSIKYCNFSDNENWWDPYFFIIQNYLRHNPNCPVKEYMTREIWKPVMLTFHYSVTLYTAINYVMTNLRKDIKYINLNDECKKEKEKLMVEEIKNFFKYLENFFDENEFFEKSSQILTRNWDESSSFIRTFDSNQIYLNYYTLTEKRFNINNWENKRKTMIYFEPSSQYDKKQTIKALRANIVHTLDAQYARLLINKYSILTIHDSFGIDIFRICQLIDDANLIMKLELLKSSIITQQTSLDQNLYSIFILL
jgi:hypothetical protein